MLSGPVSSVNLGRYEQDRSRGQRADGAMSGGTQDRSEAQDMSHRPSGLDDLDDMDRLGNIDRLDDKAPSGAAADHASIRADAVQPFPAAPRADASLPQLVPDTLSPAAAGAESSSQSAEALIGIDEVQKALNRSRASVYRYTNTDPRNLNPPFNPRRLNPEYRSDQKDPLLFHPNEVARFARDVLRIKEVTVEVLNSPSTATQQLLGSILDELRAIRHRLDRLDPQPALRHETASRFDQQSRPAA
jgi:hypothetical protein